MKNNYIFLLALLVSSISIAQNTEDFEGETAGTSSFTNNGQQFNVSGTGADSYDIFLNGFFNGSGNDNCPSCGWGGSAVDDQFLDNTGSVDATGDGSGFTIVASGGAEFGVISLYLFCFAA